MPIEARTMNVTPTVARHELEAHSPGHPSMIPFGVQGVGWPSLLDALVAAVNEGPLQAKP